MARAYDDELGQCEQDLCEYPAGHSRAQQTRASCLTDFRHNKGTIAALELITKLKIDAHRTASGVQGRLRGALTSQEIAKYVEHCLNQARRQAHTSAPMSY